MLISVEYSIQQTFATGIIVIHTYITKCMFQVVALRTNLIICVEDKRQKSIGHDPKDDGVYQTILAGKECVQGTGACKRVNEEEKYRESIIIMHVHVVYSSYIPHQNQRLGYGSYSKQV